MGFSGTGQSVLCGIHHRMQSLHLYSFWDFVFGLLFLHNSSGVVGKFGFFFWQKGCKMIIRKIVKWYADQTDKCRVIVDCGESIYEFVATTTANSFIFIEFVYTIDGFFHFEYFIWDFEPSSLRAIIVNW